MRPASSGWSNGTVDIGAYEVQAAVPASRSRSSSRPASPADPAAEAGHTGVQDQVVPVVKFRAERRFRRSRFRPQEGVRAMDECMPRNRGKERRSRPGDVAGSPAPP